MLDFSVQHNAQQPRTGTANVNVLSVTNFIEITNQAIARFGKAVIQGEVSECRYYNHLYFKIKDENSALDCLMFQSSLAMLDFKLEPGMQVVLTGRSSIYQKNGQFRFIAEKASLAGRGLIIERLMRLKADLQKEGVFDRLNRPLPRFIKRVGVITSKEGHVLHDILNTLQRRNPLIEVIIYPALVQGNDAPLSLMEALNLAYNNAEVDALIIGRGGGSFEDLLAFSDEAVVRLISLSPIPIISAVGHEPDISLSDYAADIRAATPTAAAEMVSAFTVDMIKDSINNSYVRIENAIFAHIDNLKMRIERISLKIESCSPLHYIGEQKLKLSNINSRLNQAIEQELRGYEQKIAKLQSRIQQLDPLLKLQSYKERLQKLEHRLDLSIDQELNKAAKRLDKSYNAIEQASAKIELKANERMNILAQKLLNSPLFERLTALDKRLSLVREKIIMLNPLAILDRGYSYTVDNESNCAVDDSLQIGSKIKTIMHDREIISSVESIKLKPNKKK